jgi:hypothetical protein
LLWESAGAALRAGTEVGSIPAHVPAAPLLEDLQREQKRLRLKPEALERELALDLRSETGLERSTLLHRLAALGVGWGRLTDAGGSRGTFRERWVLRWEPEFAVALVENLIYGATITQAANGRVAARLEEASSLKALAELVAKALTARLETAVARGMALIESRAAHTANCQDLLAAVPPLAQLLRYGEARATDASQLDLLLRRILVQGALALPYAARGLDEEAASALRGAVQRVDVALTLLALQDEARAAWQTALANIVADAQAARLLYEAEQFGAEEAANLLAKRLSPGEALPDAASFFEGFFEGTGERLIHDAALRGAVDSWLRGLGEDDFTAHLPLFRRAFANLDSMQRRRLLDALFNRQRGGLPGRVPIPGAEALWPAHFARLSGILTARPSHD